MTSGAVSRRTVGVRLDAAGSTFIGLCVTWGTVETYGLTFIRVVCVHGTAHAFRGSSGRCERTSRAVKALSLPFIGLEFTTQTWEALGRSCGAGEHPLMAVITRRTFFDRVEFTSGAWFTLGGVEGGSVLSSTAVDTDAVRVHVCSRGTKGRSQVAANDAQKEQEESSFQHGG